MKLPSLLSGGGGDSTVCKGGQFFPLLTKKTTPSITCYWFEHPK